MDLNKIKQFKPQLAALAGLLLLGILNYFAQTPLKFLVSGLGVIMLYYFVKQYRKDFESKLLFKRNNPNKWGGYFGGLAGGLGGVYGAVRATQLTIIGFAAELSMILIYVALFSLLITATVLEDVKRGLYNV